MIYQFLYARKNTGYCQLGDLSDAGFSQEDLAGFQSLWKYNLAEGMNRGDLPECRYFYRADGGNGPAAVIGKTAFVPGGSSKSSGDRDTTFLHKLIFTGDSRTELLRRSDTIFAPYHFFINVEEAEEQKETWNRPLSPEDLPEEETGLQASFGGADSGANRSPEEVLAHFGICSGEDRRKFLYAVFDVMTKVDLRIYLALSDKNRRESEALMSLLSKLIGALPEFVRGRFGFLTYTETFHHSGVNMIPESIRLIGIPDSRANTLKLEKYSQSNYIFGFGGTCLPEFSIDPYTENLLAAVEEKLLTGKMNPEWENFFERMNSVLPPEILIEPEQLASLFMLDTIRTVILEQGTLDLGPEYIHYIVRSVFANPALRIQEIQETAVDFLRAYLKDIGICPASLTLISDYYISLPDCRETCIQILCRQLESAAANKNETHFRMILEFPYEEPKIAEEMKLTVYKQERFYSAARFYDTIQFTNLRAVSESRRALTEKIMGVLRIRCRTNPGYVGDPETIKMVEKWLLILFPDAGTRDSSQDTYGDIYYLYLSARDFEAELMEGRMYFSLVLSLIRRLVGRSRNGNLAEQDLKSLELWQDTIMKESALQTCSPYFAEIREQIGSARFYEVFESRDGAEVLSFLSGKREVEKRRILSRLPVDLSELLSEMEFAQEEDLVRFFSVMFLYRYNDRQLIAFEILSRKERLGGFPALKKMVDSVRLKRSLDVEDYQSIEKAVKQYLYRNELSGSDIKFLKALPQFSKAIGVEPYLEEKPKRKGLFFGKK